MTLVLATALFSIVAGEAAAVEIHSAAGPRQGQLVVRAWTATAATGKTVQAAAIVVYDPASRFYWFTHLRSDRPISAEYMEKTELPPYRFATDGTALYGFRVQGDHLYARRSDERAESLGEATARAMRVIAGELEKGWPAKPEPIPPQFTELAVTEVLGLQFVRAGIPLGGVDDPFGVTVHTVALDEGQWRLGIRNRAGDVAPVYLSTDLRLLRGESRSRKNKQ